MSVSMHIPYGSSSAADSAEQISCKACSHVYSIDRGYLSNMDGVPVFLTAIAPSAFPLLLEILMLSCTTMVQWSSFSTVPGWPYCGSSRDWVWLALSWTVGFPLSADQRRKLLQMVRLMSSMKSTRRFIFLFVCKRANGRGHPLTAVSQLCNCIPEQ